MSCYVLLPSVHHPSTNAIHIYEFHNTFKMTNFPKVARAGSVVPSLRGVAPGPTCASQVPMVKSPSTQRCTLCPPRGQGRVAGADYPLSVTPEASLSSSSLELRESLSQQRLWCAVQGLSLLDEEADFSSEFATSTTLPLPFRADVVVAACCS